MIKSVLFRMHISAYVKHPASFTQLQSGAYVSKQLVLRCTPHTSESLLERKVIESKWCTD